MNRYQLLRLVGSGSFGSVSLYNSSKGKVCIKQIPKGSDDNTMVKREIYIISQVKHPNIIKFIEYFWSTNNMYLVMEYASNGTLRELLKQTSRHFQKKEITDILCDILMGLEYLHIRHVIHRDLKPENVLIGANGRKKIADFGISSIHTTNPNKRDHAAGTPMYLAPELVKGAKCDFKADVWSLGCILYELCRREYAFNVKSIRELCNQLRYPKYNVVPCNFSQGQELQCLCQEMLTYDPNLRSSVPMLVTNCTILLQYYDLYFNYTYD